MSDPIRSVLAPVRRTLLRASVRRSGVTMVTLLLMLASLTLVVVAGSATLSSAAPLGPRSASFLALNVSSWATPALETTANTSVSFGADVVGGQSPFTYNWSFGDGTWYAYRSAYNYSLLNHTFAAAPNGSVYRVQVNVTDANGTNASSAHSYYVAPAGAAPLAISATCSPTSGGSGSLLVNCTANTSGFWPRSSAQWDFGDGTTGTGSAVSHTFTASGRYWITASVVDLPGSVTSSSVAVTVGNTTRFVNPTAVIRANTTAGVAPLYVSFVGSAIVVNATNWRNTPIPAPVGMWNWSFGNGLTANGSSVAATFGGLPGANVSVYAVSLTIPYGNATTQGTYPYNTSASVTITVYNGSGTTGGATSPVASITANRTSGTAPAAVAFWANITWANRGNVSWTVDSPNTWNWTINNTAQGAGRWFNHTFAASGTYLVGVTIPSVGQSNTFANTTNVFQTTTAIYVTVAGSRGNGNGSGNNSGGSGGNGSGSPPSNNSSRPMSILARLISSVGSTPVTATFEVDVSGGTGPYRVEVSFGDGATGSYAAGAVIVHLYRSQGTYHPSATVRDSAGQVRTIALPTISVGRAASSATSGFPVGTLAVYGAAAGVLALIVAASLLARSQQRRVRTVETEGRALARALEERIRRD